MSRPATRKAAVEQAKDNAIDPAGSGAGVREWLDTLPPFAAWSAAFDTRASVAPALVTGRASKGIARQLHQHGFGQAAEPESFLVDKDNHLEPGEEERAERWGERLAAVVGVP